MTMPSPIKTIIAALTPGREDPILSWAERIARDFGAMVDGAHLRQDERLSALLFGAGTAGHVSEALLEKIRAGAREAEGVARAQFDAARERAPRSPLRSFLSLSDAPAASVSRVARCYDLAVTLTLGDPVSPAREELFDHLALDAGVPVLAVPDERPADSPLDTVMLAWDASREAGRALRAAVPFLERAKTVRVVHLGAPGAEHDPVRAATLYLEAHGVAAAATELQPRDMAEGGALLGLAEMSGADLIVMGAYGHPRWMEHAFGGATHDVLRRSSTPVLLAH